MTEMMVQKLISQRQAEQKPNSAKNRMPKPSDYEKFQVNATAYEAKGHLVHTPLWKAPVVAVEDLYQNIKNVGQGLKGKSNDHELGQMNDLAMRAGGLALAGYLATTRMLPAKKGMEFVGFASFFASMILFPKLFINAPIKAMYGFDWDQKYIDSYGRKKPFHMDPQYTPYDLYAPEKLEAIGDKMGVDQDMENRQDFIKRKMTKIATQANTIWMLTAGLATPIMSALISSGVEKGLNEAQKIRKTNQVNKNLQNADVIAEKKADKKGLEALGKFLSVHKDKPVDEEFMTQLMKLMYKDDNLTLENCLREDLNTMLRSDKRQNIAEILGDIVVEVPENQSSEKMISHTFTKENISKYLGDTSDLADFATNDESVQKITNRLSNLYSEEIGQSSSFNRYQRQKINIAFHNAVKDKLKNPIVVLTDDKIAKIKSAFKIFDNFRIKKSILGEYVNNRIAPREDSLMARQWKETADGIFKIMDFSDKELGEVKKSPAKAREIMEAKMTEIVKDENKYKKVVGKIVELVNNFDETISKSVGKEENKGFIREVADITTDFYKDFAKKSRALFLETSADYIAGNSEKNLKASAITNAVEYVDNAVLGARSSLYRIIQGFDVFRRLEDGSVDKSIKNMGLDKDKSVREKIVNMMKYAMMDGVYGDHYVKFDSPAPEIYKVAMENLFGPNLHASTKEVFESSKKQNLLTKYQEHMAILHEQLGNFGFPFKAECRFDYDGEDYLINAAGQRLNRNNIPVPDHLDKKVKETLWVKFESLTESFTDLKKQMMVGETLAKFGQKTAEGMHNTKYWQKMFGGIGAVVAAVALISPLFFGKMEAPEKKDQKEVTNNG